MLELSDDCYMVGFVHSHPFLHGLLSVKTYLRKLHLRYPNKFFTFLIKLFNSFERFLILLFLVRFHVEVQALEVFLTYKLSFWVNLTRGFDRHPFFDF